MSPAAPFLEQIAADPDDDTARLIYADWLEDQGDEQGEFIRVQCELARGLAPAMQLRAPGVEPVRSALQRFHQLRQRQKSLLTRFRGKWLGPLSGRKVRAEFRLGMVDELRLEADDFLARRKCLATHAPVLRQLQIRQTNDHRLSSQVCEAIAAISAPPSLRELDMSSCMLHGSAVAQLASAKYLSRLKRLNLAWNVAIGELGTDWLDEPWRFSELEVLDLRGAKLSARAREMLVEYTAHSKLRVLFISRPSHQRAYEYSERHLRDVFGDRLVVTY